MAVYAIGDVQGCYEALCALLDKINFDPTRDRLWFTGDLVNRGPHSLEVLRFVRNLGEGAVTVLGNHDLHLLAVAAGAARLRSNDTLAPLLMAADSERLLTWLSGRPLMHRDADMGVVLLHAGLPPQWDVAQAEAYAREAEAVIAGPDAVSFFHQMYGDVPNRWEPHLRGWDRLRFIVNAFTRTRFCDPDGRLDYRYKGMPGSQPAPLMPWFQVPDRRSQDECIVFGHWSLLGRCDSDNVIGIDTGCLWGRELTCVRLSDEPKFVSVPCNGLTKGAKT